MDTPWAPSAQTGFFHLRSSGIDCKSRRLV
uniref:Uncharacterized protein n=1 Tax=Arundo donax TaxID=35708 RepID=A0A0A9EJM6_ARUDO